VAGSCAVNLDESTLRQSETMLSQLHPVSQCGTQQRFGRLEELKPLRSRDGCRCSIDHATRLCNESTAAMSGQLRQRTVDRVVRRGEQGYDEVAVHLCMTGCDQWRPTFAQSEHDRLYAGHK
jgi:hypothetical protein